jgi:alpha-tubulin suppressor-like RCC1 family protein
VCHDDGICGPARPATAVEAGRRHTCAIDLWGGLYCWGSSDRLLEQGGSTPRRIAVDRPVEQVSISFNHFPHACVLDDEATLYCWGNNGNGELGMTPENSLVPTPVPFVDATAPVAEVACQQTATLVRLEDGALWGFGWNDSGRLGYIGPSPDGPRLVNPRAGFVQIAAGGIHGFGIDSAGVLFSWGRNTSGQLGRSGDAAPPMVAGDDYRLVTGGMSHGCGVKRSGRLYCWGSNALGQLGVPGAPGGVEHVEVLPSGGWRTVNAGDDHTCAIREDGSLWCWGSHSRGQLGIGGTTGDDVYVDQPEAVPGEGYLAVSGGTVHTCAIREGGLLYCWGSSAEDQNGHRDQRIWPGLVLLPEP